MKLANKKWTEQELFEIRKDVLAQWPTGKEVEDLDANIKWVKEHIPPTKNRNLRTDKAEEEGRIELNYAVGQATFELTKELFTYCEDLKPDNREIYTDSYTRKLKYDLAQQGIEKSYKEGYSVLNGYPMANYGVARARELVECTEATTALNASDSDPRLIGEIAFAAGFTQTVSHNLQELIQHTRDFPLAERIQNSQYLDRLSAYYSEHGGIPMQIGIPGIINGWDAAGFKIVNIVLASLLCVEQGVRDICVNPSPCLNLTQDIAVIRALRRVVPEYISRFGHEDVHVHTSSMTWQGDWPRDRERAGSLVAYCVAVGALSGVSMIRLKSIQEAFATPVKEGWRSSIIIARQMLKTIGKQRFPETKELLLEQEMLEKEVKATVDKVISLGDGDVAVGMVRGVEAGVLDTFFSPWKPLKQAVMVVRDNEGAARYLKHGNIPLPPEVVEYHRQKIAEREKAEGVVADVKMLIRDVTRVSGAIV